METPKSRFNFFVGKLGRVVFKDGLEIVAKCGQVVSVEGEHLELQTHHHRYLIRLDQILKIQEA
jgi:hypothetical protein